MLSQHFKKKKKKLTDCLEHSASSFLYENQSYKKVSDQNFVSFGNVYIWTKDDPKIQ